MQPPVFSFATFYSYNKFQTDPYADQDPWGAIAARGDLEDSAGLMQVSVINGPTAQDQAPFQWSTSNLTDIHEGQPDLFDFQFELISM